MRNRAHARGATLAATLCLTIFGAVLAPGAASAEEEPVLPKVTVTAPTNVTTTSGTMNGEVNPNGLEVTSCRFEYGTVAPGVPPYVNYAEFNHEAPCTPTLGAGSSAVAVSADISGLQPNVHYFYRITATNANGSQTGTPVELLTLSPPVIERGSVSGLGYSTATMRAEIDPVGFATTYRFEYGTTTSYGTSVPIPDGTLAASRAVDAVSEHLSSLAAGTAYHYRVVATNAIGTTDGPDQVFSTFAAAPGAIDDCPNAALRNAGLSENLPDCRAYELVSPVDKNDTDVIGQNDTNLASASGNAVLFASHNSFGDTRGSGAAGLNQYIATRGASSWQTHSVTPTPAKSAVQIFFGATLDRPFSTELGFTVVEAQQLPETEGGVPNGMDLYRENTATDQLQTVSNPQGGLEVTDPFALIGSGGGLTGGSANDLGVIAFQSTANFLLQATGSSLKLYAYANGNLDLAGVLPDGSIPAGGSSSVRSTAYESRKFKNTVSADGSRVFFTVPADESSPHQLYAREDGTRTVWISRSEASTPAPEPQGVQFQAASSDGSNVLFSSATPLLDGDSGGAGYGLYLYTASPHPETEPNLTFIGRYAEAPKVLGMSADAQRIYFRAGATLAVWDEGAIHTVTTRFLEAGKPEEDLESGALMVSANGQRAAFIGTTREGEGLLAGNANREEHTEMYLYEAPTQTLTCVSCPGNGGSALGSVETEPRATQFGIEIGLSFAHRFMSSDGRYVFFNTPEALVPQDTNGLADAYEYNVETGSVSLLSSGTGDRGAWFVDASANGDDAFFVTQQPYSRSDPDNLVDLYDARVDGGLPEPPSPAVPCAGDACQGTPSAVPSFSTASGFSGLGNMKPAPASKAKHKGKPRKHSVKRRARHRPKHGYRTQSKGAVKRASHRTGR